MDKKKSRDTEHAEYKRANPTIGIVPTNGMMTPVIRRLFNYALYVAHRVGKQERYEVPLPAVMEAIEYNSNDHNVLKIHLRTMMSLVVEWNEITEKGAKKWTGCPLLGHASIETGSNGSYSTMEWSFSPPIADHVHQLKEYQYTRLSLSIYAQLVRHSAMALYEICARYATNPSKVTGRAPLEWWDPVLTGKPRAPDALEVNYKYFKRDVIMHAVDEINQLAHKLKFTVKLIPHKRGRKVTEIQFQIVPTENAVQSVDFTTGVDDDTLVRCLQVNVPPDDAKRLVKQFGLVRFLQGLTLMEARLAKKNLPKIDSPVAYLTKAIKKNYVPSPSNAAGKPKKIPELGPEQKINSIKEQIQLQRLDDAWRMYHELEPEQKEAMRLEFCQDETQLPQHRQAVRLKGLGDRKKSVATAFKQWVAHWQWGDITEADVQEYLLRNFQPTQD